MRRGWFFAAMIVATAGLLTASILIVAGRPGEEKPVILPLPPPQQSWGFFNSFDGQIEGGWMPSEQLVAAAEPRIRDFILRSNSRIFSNLGHYRCQYFGIVVNGRKRVFCNFFWLDEFTRKANRWQKGAVITADGGEGYFQLEYDVESGACFGFRVNSVV